MASPKLCVAPRRKAAAANTKKKGAKTNGAQRCTNRRANGYTKKDVLHRTGRQANWLPKKKGALRRTGRRANGLPEKGARRCRQRRRRALLIPRLLRP